jgi:dolichol-phosphate mannosyltransferase
VKLSVIVPVFNEEAVIQEFCLRLESVISVLIKDYGLNREEIEVIFVNDGSTDHTFDLLQHFCENHSGYRMINLSRNYGHQIAITAGIENSTGEAAAIIDADLQDPPEFILNLYRKFLEGYDVVSAVRSKREGETFFKLLTAKIFYRVMKRLTKVDIPVDAGDFRIISRRVAEALSRMKEKHRFVRGMVSWVGFKQTSMEYVREKRFAGETKYPLRKMLKFALDAITSFSSIPLRLSSYLGFIAASLGFLYSLVIFYTKFFTDRTVPGWTSIIIVVLFLGGVQLICLGMIGEYLSRLSEETKNRPLYLIEGIYPEKKQ